MAVKSMPVGLERLITMADKEKQKKEREYINKRTDALIKYREELYKKDRQREKDNVKEVMEGLNVSKAEAEKLKGRYFNAIKFYELAKKYNLKGNIVDKRIDAKIRQIHNLQSARDILK